MPWEEREAIGARGGRRARADRSTEGGGCGRGGHQHGTRKKKERWRQEEKRGGPGREELRVGSGGEAGGGTPAPEE